MKTMVQIVQCANVGPVWVNPDNVCHIEKEHHQNTGTERTQLGMVSGMVIYTGEAPEDLAKRIEKAFQ